MRIVLLTILLLQIGMGAAAQDMLYFFEDRDMMSVSQSELQGATDLKDLHPRYRADWVATYISTKITITKNGTSVSATGVDGTLTKEQKDLLLHAAIGSDIAVGVKYLPQNNLRHNTPKEMNYTFDLVPAVSAAFPGGESQMNAYIDQAIINKLSPTQKENTNAEKITFTVLADGSITAVRMPESSDDAALDALLLAAITAMPQWTPAQNLAGQAVPQSIDFYISNSRSTCLLPLR